MSFFRHSAAIAIAFALSPAHAQEAKELKTKKGVSVALINLMNARPDCKPSPIALPALHEKPANGTIQIQIAVADVAASGNCPAHKVPTLVLIYTPKTDFVGGDSVRIDLETGNRTVTFNYHITVQGPPAGEAL
jgi:hypothetical protein